MAVPLTSLPLHNLNREGACTWASRQPLHSLQPFSGPGTREPMFSQSQEAPGKCRDWLWPRGAWQDVVLGSGQVSEKKPRTVGCGFSQYKPATPLLTMGSTGASSGGLDTRIDTMETSSGIAGGLCSVSCPQKTQGLKNVKPGSYPIRNHDMTWKLFTNRFLKAYYVPDTLQGSRLTGERKPTSMF